MFGGIEEQANGGVKSFDEELDEIAKEVIPDPSEVRSKRQFHTKNSPQRKELVRRVLAGEAVKEVADELGLSASAAKNWVYEAKAEKKAAKEQRAKKVAKVETKKRGRKPKKVYEAPPVELKEQSLLVDGQEWTVDMIRQIKIQFARINCMFMDLVEERLRK